MANFRPGDRVKVNCPGLAELRSIMEQATGEPPAPNHHGTVREICRTGLVLIEFDDGTGSPWDAHLVEKLEDYDV